MGLLDSLMSRRAALRGLAGSSMGWSWRPALSQELSSEYRRLVKAAWAWRIEPSQLPGMIETIQRLGLSRILLSLSRPMLESLLSGRTETIDALKSLRDHGISIGALLGQKEWVRQPNVVPVEIFSALRIHARTGLFDSLHLDIEPYTLPEWHETSREVIAAQYLELVSRLRETADTVPIEAAIHPMYADISVPGKGNLLASLAKLVDDVGLMAYRNSPQAAVQFASEAIRVLELSGANWRFGVLTHPDEAQRLTYAGVSSEDFQRSMVSLDHMLSALSPSGRYRGLIFEDYFGLVTLVG